MASAEECNTSTTFQGTRIVDYRNRDAKKRRRKTTDFHKVLEVILCTRAQGRKRWKAVLC